jgi:hypothetical protein
LALSPTVTKVVGVFDAFFVLASPEDKQKAVFKPIAFQWFNNAFPGFAWSYHVRK